MTQMRYSHWLSPLFTTKSPCAFLFWPTEIAYLCIITYYLGVFEIYYMTNITNVTMTYIALLLIGGLCEYLYMNVVDNASVHLLVI